jgi:pyruvate dehydrogenase E1 component alpha subunit
MNESITKVNRKKQPNNKAASAKKTASLFKAFDPLHGKRLEILNENGEIVNRKWMPDLSKERLVEGYKTMLMARQVDLKAVSYQRQGRLYTLPPSMGQEAAAVGSAMALDKKDWIVPAFRELGALLYKGVSLDTIWKYFSGSEYGNVYPPELRLLPTSVPISSQLPHAVGIAHAINYRKEKDVVLTYFGDGGTSEGDFSEAMNWAAVFHCPVIFFCNNNQYAISVPRRIQTITKTLAQKAVAYGMPGIQVDGNDFPAVYRAAAEAVRHARDGNGPVLIEAETYRLGAHTTSDDPTKYRSGEEENVWRRRDPLLRMKKYLISEKLWSEEKEKEHVDQYSRMAEETMKEAEKFPPNSLEEIFSHQYEEMPGSLKSQMFETQRFMNWKGGN